MSARRTVVLAVVFVCLAAYFILFEGISVAPTAPEWQRAEKIVRCAPRGFQALEVRSAKGRLVAERAGDGWRVTTPAVDPDTAARMVTDLAQALCELPVIDRIPAPASLADFGLERPSVELRMVHEGRSEVLLLGEDSPARNLMYAKFAERADVLKVGALLRMEVDKVAAHATPDPTGGSPVATDRRNGA